MKKILLTGGSGFIGKNILESLGGQYSFFHPSHAELDLLDSDAVLEYLKNNPVDVIIHTANKGGKRTDADSGIVVADNLKIFFNLVRAKKFFGKMIFLGSGAEYDKSRSISMMREDGFGESVPKDSYGFYKYVCSEYIGEVDFIVNLRLFGVYGKYEDYRTRFISNAICRSLLGLPISMNQNVLFDYMFVDDFVKVLAYFIEHKPQEKFFNVGTGAPVDLLAIAEKIKEKTNNKHDIVIKKEGLNLEYTCTNSKLLEEFKNLKITNIDEALDLMVVHYKAILPTIDKNTLLCDN